MQTIDRNLYGTIERNGLVNGAAYHDDFATAPSVDWSDPNLAKITRLRLLSDPGYPFWDVSYVHGVMKDGTKVVVDVPFSQLPKRNMMGALLDEARADRLYLKRIFDRSAISTLN